MTKSGVSLAVEGLRKGWGATEGLTGIDFDIEPGGFLTLLGPSGCGKVPGCVWFPVWTK